MPQQAIGMTDNEQVRMKENVSSRARLSDKGWNLYIYSGSLRIKFLERWVVVGREWTLLNE